MMLARIFNYINTENDGWLWRAWQLLLGWGCVGFIYGLSDALQGQGVVLAETWMDRLIPFDAVGIWMYTTFFLLIPMTYFVADSARVLWLRKAMQCCALASGVIFLACPTTLHYPEIVGDGVSVRFLRFLASSDSSQNCLPSLHGGLTLLCVWAWQDGRFRLRSLFAIVWGVLICFSIIQLRRHVSIDLGAGLLCGMLSGAVCLRGSSVVVKSGNLAI
jgi:hypothetical protein